MLLIIFACLQAQTTWQFDRLDKIGGHPVTVVGHPKVIGKAIEFDGQGDALFLDVHPLAGAAQFTLEVIFRPDRGGRAEQRFFHLQENGSEHRRIYGYSDPARATEIVTGSWLHVQTPSA